MVLITVKEASGGDILAIECSGHAEFDESGSDIVCAGVSALTGALALGLTEVLKLPVQPGAADGRFAVNLGHLSPEALAQAQVLARTFLLAVEQLEGVYEGFVEVRRHPARADSQAD